VASYAYNADGLRMSRTVGGTTSDETWGEGAMPLLLQDGSTDYVYGPTGAPLEQISSSGTASFCHHDQAGSTRTMANSAGTVVATYTYDPYGNVHACTGATVTINGTNKCTGTITVTNPLMFQGQYRDNETNRYYLRARYCNPVTAQFLTVDPMVSTTRSPCAYVSGNPLNEADPSGAISQDALTQDEIDQIYAACSSWVQQSMCLQSAFCTGDDCHAVGQIAIDDYNIV